MSERKISTRIEITGEKQYKESLKGINAELKENRSELTYLNQKYSESANTIQALSEKQDALNKIWDHQKEKVALLSSKVDAAKKSQEEFNAQVEQARQKVSSAEKEQSRIAETLGKSSKEYREIGKELEQYRKELQREEECQQKCTNSLHFWTTKLNEAKTEQDKFDKELKENQKYLDEAKNSADQCAISIDQYGRRQKEAAEATEQGSEALEKGSGAIDSLAGALAASGIQGKLSDIAGEIRECVQEADRFETSIAKISTLADGMDTEGVSAKIIKLSGDTGIAAGDISDAVYQAISASVDAERAVEFVEKANKLSVAGFTESATAVDILTTAINAYRLSESEAAKISDYLITTQNLGKTTVDDLAKSYGKVIPVAGAYNVGMDNLSSGLVILTRNGIATAESSTYLRQMLQELGDTSSEVSGILQEETGSSFAGLSAQGKNLGEILDILYQSVGRDTTEFNALWASATAGTAALSIAGSGVKEYNAVMQEMQASTGATEKAYQTMTDTAEHANKRMETSLNNLKIVIGKQLSPALVELEGNITDASDIAMEYVSEHPEIVAMLGALVSALGVVTGATTVYTVASKVLIGVIKDFWVALSANPIALAVAALATLTAAAVAYAAVAEDATKESKELAKSTRELKEDAEGAAESYKASSEEYQKNADHIRALWKQTQELLAVENKTAEEKKELIDLVEELNVLVPDLGLSYDQLTDSLNKTTEAADALIRAQAGQDAYDAAIEARTEAYLKQQQAQEDLLKVQKELADAEERAAEAGKRTPDLQNMPASEIPRNITQEGWYRDLQTATRNVKNYREAVENAQAALQASSEEYKRAGDDAAYYGLIIADLESHERALVNTELDIIDTLGRESEEWSQSVEALSILTETHMQHCTAIQADISGIEAEMSSLKASYGEAYESAYSSINGQLGLFETVKTETSQSVDDMMKALDSQLEYLNTFSENMAIASEWGIDELLTQLSDGSVESAAVLQEIVDAGEEKAKALNDKLATVEEGKQNFAEQMAELQTDFSESMTALEDRLDQATAKMNKENEAFQSGVSTIEGYINGAESERANLIVEYESLAEAVMAAFNKALKINSPSVKFEESAEYTVEGAEKGVEKNKGKLSASYVSLANDAYEAYENENKRLQQEGLRQGTLILQMMPKQESVDPDGVMSAAYDRLMGSMYSKAKQGSGPVYARAGEAGSRGATNEVTAYLMEYLPYLADIANKNGNVYLDGKKITDEVESRISRNQRMEKRSAGR